MKTSEQGYMSKFYKGAVKRNERGEHSRGDLIVIELYEGLANLEAELAACRERSVTYAKERVAIVEAAQAMTDALRWQSE